MKADQLVSVFRQFRPRLLDHLPGYSRQHFTADLSAGLTVGFVALPLAMTFAIASGLPPQSGLFTAIIAGFLISLLGGSSVQIGGPAGAFIVVVYAIVERYGVPNLLIATACAGVLMMIMGALRLGNLIRLIPISIVSGFTSGIAVLIGLSQIKEFFGLSGPALPAEFFAKLAALWSMLPTINWTTVGLGVVCLAIIVSWPKSNQSQASLFGRAFSRMPGSLVAIVLSTVAVSMLQLPVETVGQRFGAIPTGLPMPSFPDFDWGTVQFLVGPIITIALLGSIESLLCARVADGLTKERHDPNQELIAQGVANIASPLFGGFCATGTIARTVTNIKSGARTPVAGMVHALALLAIVLGAAPLAEMIPLVSLAATALVVAYNMGEWHSFANMKQYSPPYRITLLTTFALTVIIDITVAVEVGLLLAGIFFIRRMSQLTKVEHVSREELEAEGIDTKHLINTEVKRLTGVLFFGAVSKIEPLLDPRRKFAPVVVLDLTALLAIDSTGIDAIKTLDESLAARGVELRLTHIRPVVLSTMTRWGLISHFGEKRVFPTLRGALGLA
ncbi:STAS domain-containing protein [Betaproteobacteria bacterium LSUCC0115]|nr:STAS domain-containing protein [Burkholderiales bacterium LSUCC0115]